MSNIYSKVKEQCEPYRSLIALLRAVACMCSAPHHRPMCEDQSDSAIILLDKPPLEAEGLPAAPAAWDAGMTQIDKVTLAASLTQANKTTRLEFMRSACANQGLEIVSGRLHAVRTAEEVKNLMEGSSEPA